MAVHVQHLNQQVRYFRSISFAPNTKRTYSVHRKTYILFCNAIGAAPVPASSELLCQYVAYLANKLKYRSIRQYLNIIRLLHAEWNLPNPCVNNFPLDSTLRGIKRHLGDTVSRKAPITPELLYIILSRLDVSKIPDASVWAACLLMFFGLLRRSNVVTPETGFDPQKHLCRSDLVFTKQGLRVKLRWTKTLQFKEEELVVPYPWDRGNKLCPTQAAFNAVRLTPQVRGQQPGLVMDNKDPPSPLTAPLFIKYLRRTLGQSVKDTNSYAGHSFRRGGGMWAFQQNVPLESIRHLGRWRSEAYKAYILPTDAGLALTTKTMVLATRPS